MRRVFKTRFFGRWMRKTELTDSNLCMAVSEMAAGLVDADLGGGVLKKRVPLPGRGKSGSVRTLIATNRGNRWFFVFGFEKASRSTINPEEEAALKMLAADLLKLTSVELEGQVNSRALVEICHEESVQGKKPDPRRRS